MIVLELGGNSSYRRQLSTRTRQGSRRRGKEIPSTQNLLRLNLQCAKVRDFALDQRPILMRLQRMHNLWRTTQNRLLQGGLVGSSDVGICQAIFIVTQVFNGTLANVH